MWNFGPKGKWYGRHKKYKIKDMDYDHIDNCINMLFSSGNNSDPRVGKKVCELEKELDIRRQRRIHK